MRIIDILTEDSLSKAELSKHDGKYLKNLIALIKSNTPLEVTAKAQAAFGDSVVLKQSAIKAIKDGLTNNVKSILLTTTDSKLINLTSLEKTPAIKGDSKEYNVGYIGEIALGVATAAKFLGAGKVVGPHEFVALANALEVSQVMNKDNTPGNSLRLKTISTIKHASGKSDNFTVEILAPNLNIKSFKKFMRDPGNTPLDARGAILSALVYANKEEKIKAGIEKTAKDPNTNTIQVISDGISDNKGTKADLVMEIDGSRINLLSVKTGPSQLGQASGHEWNKQESFFKYVFQVDASPYQKLWGKTNQEHLLALRAIWTKLVIPKVLRLTGGDIVEQEKELVKSIANGLIRYSNNYNVETGEIENVDIVKLVVEPNSPGYKLMKIDGRLTAALEKVDLIGSVPAGGMGVNIHGIINFTNSKGKVVKKKVALCRFWSSYSSSGDVVRTAVAGGALLDELALVTPATSAQLTPAQQVPIPQQQPTPVRPRAKAVPPPAPKAVSAIATPAVSPVAVADAETETP